MVMMGSSGLGLEDLYIIQKPSFNSMTHCIAFVQSNDPYLVAKAQTEYPGRDVKNIYCVLEDDLKNLMYGAQNKKKSS